MHFRSSSGFIPSTPAALLFASRGLSASNKFSRFRISSSLISVNADWSCAVFSIPITAIAPPEPLSIPWIPKLWQVLRFLRHATLCQRYRTPIDSVLWLVLTYLLCLLLSAHSRFYSACSFERTSVSSPGKNMLFSTMHQPHLHLGVRVSSGFVL